MTTSVTFAVIFRRVCLSSFLLDCNASGRKHKSPGGISCRALDKQWVGMSLLLSDCRGPPARYVSKEVRGRASVQSSAYWRVSFVFSTLFVRSRRAPTCMWRLLFRTSVSGLYNIYKILVFYNPLKNHKTHNIQISTYVVFFWQHKNKQTPPPRKKTALRVLAWEWKLKAHRK